MKTATITTTYLLFLTALFGLFSCEAPQTERLELMPPDKALLQRWEKPEKGDDKLDVALEAGKLNILFDIHNPEQYPRLKFKFDSAINLENYDALEIKVSSDSVPQSRTALYSRTNFRIDFLDKNGVATNKAPLYELSGLTDTAEGVFALKAPWESVYPKPQAVNHKEITSMEVFVNVGKAAPVSAQGKVVIESVSLVKYPMPSEVPSAVQLSAKATSSNRIKLSWNSAANRPTSYKVFRSLDGEKWGEIASLEGTQFWDGDLKAGKEYFYKVVASNEIGDGSYSEVQKATTKESDQVSYDLLWEDEFEGEQLKGEFWNYQIGNGCIEGQPWMCGWGNEEKEYYTDRPENIKLEDGKLIITARKEEMGGVPYTSARINTKGKVDVKFGRVEAKVKLPKGQGLWPAFWMLPTNQEYGGWPKSGEIDIMEFLGHEPDKAFGTLHFGQSWPKNAYLSGEYFSKGKDFTEAYHVFAIEWEPTEIRWYVDGNHYSTLTKNDLAPEIWPFDKEFYIILNLAVGGHLPGEVGPDTGFPATMEVDYVRVFKPAE